MMDGQLKLKTMKYWMLPGCKQPHMMQVEYEKTPLHNKNKAIFNWAKSVFGEPGVRWNWRPFSEPAASGLAKDTVHGAVFSFAHKGDVLAFKLAWVN